MKENKITYSEIKVVKSKDKTSFSIDINIEWSKDFILSHNLSLLKAVSDLEKNYKKWVKEIKEKNKGWRLTKFKEEFIKILEI